MEDGCPTDLFKYDSGRAHRLRQQAKGVRRSAICADVEGCRLRHPKIAPAPLSTARGTDTRSDPDASRNGTADHGGR